MKKARGTKGLVPRGIAWLAIAERRKKVEERGLVRQVDDREAQTPLVAVAMEKVVIAHASVKQIARHHPRRIAVHVKLAECGNVDSLGAHVGLIRARRCCQT